MSYQIKTVKVSSLTHKHLSRLGKKGDTYDDIITGLIKEHLQSVMFEDIKQIVDMCDSKVVLKKSDSSEPVRVMSYEDELNEISRIFDSIGFDYGVYPDTPLKNVVELASDEDMVGGGVAFGDRDLLLSEVAVNCYCIYLDMPSPTTGLGAMIPPLSPH